MDAVISAAGRPPRVFAVLNPASKRFADAERAVRDAVPEATVLTTTREQAGGPQASEAVASGADLVLVGGGDGTIREVAHVLAGTPTELGIVPIGTANLVAHNLGLRTRDVTRAVATALSAPTRRIDVGRATWRRVDHGVLLPAETHTFLVMAGLGHDAATVLAVRPESKRRLGWPAYLAAGARQLRSRPIRMRVSVDSRPVRELATWSLLVANMGRLPSGIRVFPDARPDDGVLDTLEVPLTHVAQWGPVALTGVGLARESPALRYGTARRVWAIPDHPTPLQLDGDVVDAVADLHLILLPGALGVRAPDRTPR